MGLSGSGKKEGRRNSLQLVVDVKSDTSQRYWNGSDPDRFLPEFLVYMSYTPLPIAIVSGVLHLVC